MTDNLTREEESALIHCATRATLTVRAMSRRRLRILGAIVRKGYLRTVNPEDTFNAGSALATIAENALVTLTEKGKAHILALIPEDFEKVRWFPLPDDIRNAQQRVTEGPHDG